MRRGVTLIEVLIATLVLAIVVIPVATFIIGGLRRTEISKHSTIAMATASNIMDELINPALPFAAIDPTGSSGDGGVAGGTLPKTLPDCGGKRQQATFKTTGGADAGKLERILNDGKKPDTRIKFSQEGLEFEVFFFAGVYKDFVATKPDVRSELTFAYLPNPYVPPDLPKAGDPPDSHAGGQRVLAQPAAVVNLFPYIRGPQGKTPTAATINDYYPGWPKPTRGYNAKGTALKDDILAVFDEFDTKSQKKEFFAFFEDQRRFGRADGGLMKLVLGVRWNPNAHVGKGLGYTKNSKELWLVSFKADLTQK